MKAMRLAQWYPDGAIWHIVVFLGYGQPDHR
jgi:hypothetical protein